MPDESRPAESGISAALGTACAMGGAAAYGVTVVIGRALATDDLGAPTVLGIRFGGAAILLLALLAILRRPLVPPPGERLRAFLLGGFGYGVESSLFFAGLERGSAAAVTLLFYSYPAVVTLIEIPLTHRRPARSLVAALGLSLAGTLLIVAAGADVSITGVGVVFSLGAAVAFSLYMIGGDRLLKRTDPATIAAWVAAGAALSLLLRGVVFGELRSPAGHWPELLGNGVATAAAFSLMFAALRLLGPSRTAVLMTLEAFSAIVLARLFLDEPFGWIQLVGGLAILGGAVVIGTARSGPAEVVEPAITEPP